MIIIFEENVYVVRVDGILDDLDVLIKNCFLNLVYVVVNNFCMINLINWCRILV